MSIYHYYLLPIISGTSAGTIQEGYGSLWLLNHDEEYRFTFPAAIAKGFIMGPLTMELFGLFWQNLLFVNFAGEIEITCAQTGYRAAVEFKTKVKTLHVHMYNNTSLCLEER